MNAAGMLLIYRLCLIIGGAFVGLAALGGLDGVDFDNPLDTDLELTEGKREEADPSLTRIPPQRSLWRSLAGILTSFKFWTFGTCFFGLTGVLLTWLQPTLPASAIALIAIAIGLLCGITMATVLRALHRGQANSLIRSSNWIGLVGTVQLPFDASSRGKVRLRIGGATLDVIAYTDISQALQRGDRVLVVGKEQNRIWVVPEATLREPPRELDEGI
jgi:hypothetical protein